MDPKDEQDTLDITEEEFEESFAQILKEQKDLIETPLINPSNKKGEE